MCAFGGTELKCKALLKRPWVDAQCAIGHGKGCTGYLVFIAVPSVKETTLYNTFLGTLKGNKFYLQKDVELFEVTCMIEMERPQHFSVQVKSSEGLCL